MNISSIGSSPVTTATSTPAPVVQGTPVASGSYRVASSQTPAAAQPENVQKQADGAAESQANTREKLNEAVEKANGFLRPINSSVEFTTHEDTGQIVVRVVDLQTKEVIRQIPNEEMVQISRALDKLQGLLIHQKV